MQSFNAGRFEQCGKWDAKREAKQAGKGVIEECDYHSGGVTVTGSSRTGKDKELFTRILKYAPAVRAICATGHILSCLTCFVVQVFTEPGDCICNECISGRIDSVSTLESCL